MTDAPDTIICAVCQEAITSTDSSHALPCGHSFHVGCIVDWFRQGESNICPVCRDTGPQVDSSSDESSVDEESDTTMVELEHFRLFSSRSDVNVLTRASLSAARSHSHPRSRSMQRLHVRAQRFLKATGEANEARDRAKLFLRTHSGALLSGLKRYNALVRMWGTRERRLRDAALDLYTEYGGW